MVGKFARIGIPTIKPGINAIHIAAKFYVLNEHTAVIDVLERFAA